MSCENGEILNKRNCPLCGACVILCKKKYTSASVNALYNK